MTITSVLCHNKKPLTRGLMRAFSKNVQHHGDLLVRHLLHRNRQFAGGAIELQFGLKIFRCHDGISSRTTTLAVLLIETDEFRS
jgi:hypothetical protein